MTVLVDWPGSELNKYEKRADDLIRRHLAGYAGVISHGAWRGLRDEIAPLLRPKPRRKKKRGPATR